MSQVLKDVISEVTKKEYQELLKKWSDTYSSDEKKLAERGIIPIPRGKRSKNASFLGEGAYAETYEVLWKGKHAVAKITAIRSDLVAVEKLNELRNDKRISKNILKMHDLFLLDKKETLWCTIVEYLVPTPKHLTDDIWGTSSNEQLDQYDKEKREAVKLEDIIELIKDEYKEAINDRAGADVTIEQMTIYANAVNKLNDVFSSGLIDKIAKAFHDQIISLSEKDLELTTNSRLKPTQYIKNIFNQTIEMLEIDPFDAWVKIMFRNIIESIENIFLDRRKFPKSKTTGYKAKLMLNHPDPRVRSLMKTLLILEKEYGISWYDLHDENIMMRPKTGDLVISDPGLFEF